MKLKWLETHLQVYELPSNAELLASSEKTSMEMFAVEDRVLCIQGHPEYKEDIVLDILDVCLKKNLMPVGPSIDLFAFVSDIGIV